MRTIAIIDESIRRIERAIATTDGDGQTLVNVQAGDLNIVGKGLAPSSKSLAAVLDAAGRNPRATLAIRKRYLVELLDQ